MLLDEDLPRQLGHELAGHDVPTVREMGWNGLKNGVLLRLASASGFEVFPTADRGIPYQQNVSALGLAVVVLAARDNKIDTIHSIIPDILSVPASEPRPASVTVVGNWRVS